MACSKLTVVESDTDDFLTCRICFEMFTDPRILPCLHTYCFQCICSHVDTSQTEGRPVVCPECREPFPATVCTLKTNFFINGLADVLKEKSRGDVPCTICHLRGRESQAEVKCLDCGDHLCSQCGSGHHASSLTWDHQVIPLGDIQSGKYDGTLRKLQKIFCSKHDDLVKNKIVVEKLMEFSSKGEYESKAPDVRGMFYSPVVGLVISDYANGKIKIFNDSDEFVRAISQTGFKPRAVTVIGDTIATISENYLFIFTKAGSLNGKITVSEIKPNEGFIFTISLTGSEASGFVVGNIPEEKSLKFYDMSGKLTRVLQLSVTLPISALSITPDAEIILGEWRSGNLIVISTTGERVCTVEEPKRKPNGMCVSRNGTIFVASTSWHGIGIFGKSGEYLFGHKTNADGIQNPMAVAMKDDGLLYITGRQGDISVYHVSL